LVGLFFKYGPGGFRAGSKPFFNLLPCRCLAAHPNDQTVVLCLREQPIDHAHEHQYVPCICMYRVHTEHARTGTATRPCLADRTRPATYWQCAVAAGGGCCCCCSSIPQLAALRRLLEGRSTCAAAGSASVVVSTASRAMPPAGPEVVITQTPLQKGEGNPQF
jgi:hypothetical protein